MIEKSTCTVKMRANVNQASLTNNNGRRGKKKKNKQMSAIIQKSQRDSEQM